MEQTPSDSGWRGSSEGWLQAAYDALLDGGVDAVKILPLARQLNLSRTSFYWFFRIGRSFWRRWWRAGATRTRAT